MKIGCFALVEPFAPMARQFHAIKEMGIECADLTDNHQGGMLGVEYGFAASVSLDSHPAKIRRWATEAGIELRVHPTLIPEKRLIANVNGAMNAVLVKGDAVGPTLYYGKGAGAEPTASSVVADLVDVTRMCTADPHQRVPHLAFQPDQLSDLPILSMSDVRTAYYLRLRVKDQPGVLADITRILADRGVSIDAMVQKEPSEGEERVDIIMLTHETRERQINAAISAIENLAVVSGKVTRIRLEELGRH